MALKDVIIGYAKGDKGDKGDTGERGATGQTGPQGEPGNIADAAITDTQGLDVAKGAKTTAQKLFDAIADRIVNKLVTNDTLTTKLADYLLKSAMSSTNINSTTNVPTSALVYSLLQDVNNNLSKKLSVLDDIASAYLTLGSPEERFGTLSMCFSDGTMNQLLLLKDTAAVTIFRNNVWTEQYRFATKSDLSNFQFISANNFDDAWNKAEKNTMCFADITGNTDAPIQDANRWFAQIFKNDTENYGWITTWSFTGGVYKKERTNSSSWTDWHS